jgi:anti-anti-sigma regulatory factor
MVTSSGVGNDLPSHTKAETGLAAPSSRQSATARSRMRAPGAGPCAEAPGRSQQTLALPGSIDATTAEMVLDRAARCLRDQPDVLVLDLRETDFCDSAGVRALRWVLRRAALVGATVCALPPGEGLRHVLTSLRAYDLLAVIDPAGSARAS